MPLLLGCELLWLRLSLFLSTTEQPHEDHVPHVDGLDVVEGLPFQILVGGYFRQKLVNIPPAERYCKTELPAAFGVGSEFFRRSL